MYVGVTNTEEALYLERKWYKFSESRREENFNKKRDMLSNGGQWNFLVNSTSRRHSWGRIPSKTWICEFIGSWKMKERSPDNIGDCSRNQSNSSLKEKEVLEPERSSEEYIVKRSESGRQIGGASLSLKRSQSVDGTPKRGESVNVRRLKTRNLKVPEIPKKIVNIVNILQHENFLEVVDQFFKPTTANKKSQKKAKSRKSGTNKNSECKPRFPMQIRMDNRTM